MNVRHRTLTTGKILWSDYLDNRFHGNQKAFSWLIGHLKSNGFLKGWYWSKRETVSKDFWYHGNQHVVIAPKMCPCEAGVVNGSPFLFTFYYLIHIYQCSAVSVNPSHWQDPRTIYWELPLTRGYRFSIGSCPSRGAVAIATCWSPR